MMDEEIFLVKERIMYVGEDINHFSDAHSSSSGKDESRGMEHWQEGRQDDTVGDHVLIYSVVSIHFGLNISTKQLRL